MAPAGILVKFDRGSENGHHEDLICFLLEFNHFISSVEVRLFNRLDSVITIT